MVKVWELSVWQPAVNPVRQCGLMVQAFGVLSRSPLLIFMFSSLIYSSQSRIILFFIFAWWLLLYLGCSWASFNMSAKRGSIGTLEIVDGSAKTCYCMRTLLQVFELCRDISILFNVGCKKTKWNVAMVCHVIITGPNIKHHGKVSPLRGQGSGSGTDQHPWSRLCFSRVLGKGKGRWTATLQSFCQVWHLSNQTMEM